MLVCGMVDGLMCKPFRRPVLKEQYRFRHVRMGKFYRPLDTGRSVSWAELQRQVVAGYTKAASKRRLNRTLNQCMIAMLMFVWFVLFTSH